MKINLNDKVKVKLTKYGESLLKEWEDEILAYFPAYRPHILADKDKDGFISMQLHGLFEMFGKGISISSKSPFEKCEIIIDE